MSVVLPLANLNSPIGWIVILILGFLLFGRRLPGVARNLGQGINEFKKGLSEGSVATKTLEDETQTARDAKATPPAPAKKTEIEETSV